MNKNPIMPVVEQPKHVNNHSEEEITTATLKPCVPTQIAQRNGPSICRLCGKTEEDRDLESGVSTMIWPCKCSAGIHRECLDRWRAVKGSESFVKCDGCDVSYRLEVKEGVNVEKRKSKFGLLFFRDTLAFLVIVQLIILACAFLVERVDSCSGKGGCGTNCKPHCGENNAPGGKLLNLFFIGKWEMGYKATYYLLGLALFLLFLGIVALIVSAYRKIADKKFCDCSGELDSMCMFFHLSSATRMASDGSNDGSILPTNECCNCCTNCSTCRDDSCCGSSCCCQCEGTAGLLAMLIGLIVFLVIIVAFIVFGAVFGFIGVTIVATRIFQRHYHILKRTELAKIYIVKDLKQDDRMNLSLTESYQFPVHELQRLGFLK
eukprot:TRINITY_DN1511_c0_g4_i1.p1 TRINITY_DN1511_c0_g4~~TRINITY_DN1511_c0_g4_i1.p1  ORF type:complete len:377 (+),score=78.83 TRINITY_DN1511_c0_g4_i1:109-1239(+)